jgi:hypothetical protein
MNPNLKIMVNSCDNCNTNFDVDKVFAPEWNGAGPFKAVGISTDNASFPVITFKDVLIESKCCTLTTTSLNYSLAAFNADTNAAIENAAAWTISAVTRNANGVSFTATPGVALAGDVPLVGAYLVLSITDSCGTVTAYRVGYVFRTDECAREGVPAVCLEKAFSFQFCDVDICSLDCDSGIVFIPAADPEDNEVQGRFNNQGDFIPADGVFANGFFDSLTNRFSLVFNPGLPCGTDLNMTIGAVTISSNDCVNPCA